MFLAIMLAPPELRKISWRAGKPYQTLSFQ
jgi:hypothetical protein